MKKTLNFLILLVFALFISVNLQAQTATAPTDGAGTADDPYEISSIENLNWISQNSWTWSKHFIQMQDIDASETSGYGTTYFKGFNPIGR